MVLMVMVSQHRGEREYVCVRERGKASEAFPEKMGWLAYL